MANVLQLLVAGVATGAVYALAATGFTLLWQTSQTVNFAQGEFVMLPAFVVLLAMNLGLPLPAAILIGIAASLGVLGFLFKQAVVDRTIRHGALPLAISTIAFGLLLKEGVKDVAGVEALPFPSLGGTVSVAIGDALFPLHSLIAIVVAVAAIAGLQVFLDRASLGRSIQATVQNPAVARVLGIPVERMLAYAFLINAALTALASILVTPVYLASFTNGEWLGLCTFVAALAGGLNLRGAIVAGLVLGFIDNLAAVYLSATGRGALPLVILMAVVLLRPQGLFGRSEEPAA
jgi:branched-chain amino acid transport system permease protein